MRIQPQPEQTGRAGLVALALVSLWGCGDLSVPDTATQVRVMRAPAGHAAPLAVPMSRTRAAAVLPCLKQAVRADAGEALAAADAGGVGDVGVAAGPGGIGAGLPEGAYVVELTDAAGQRSTLRLVSQRDLVGPGGRRFVTRCLYALVRDRSVSQGF